MERLTENSSCWDFSGVYDVTDSPDPGCGTRIDLRKLPGTSCYCDEPAAERISAEMDRTDPGILHLIDSGNYHYLTWFFLRRIRRRTLLVVFDNHTDMQPPAFSGLLSCGGWILEALRDFPCLSEVWIIGPDQGAISGVDPDDRHKVRFLSGETLESWRSGGTLAGKTEEWFLEGYQNLREKDPALSGFYLSIDKDILSPEYARTAWSQGSTSLPELICMIRSVLRIAQTGGLSAEGVDICGESAPDDPAGCFLGARSNRELFDLFRTDLVQAPGHNEQKRDRSSRNEE